MTGFELYTSGVGTDRSAYWATTSAQIVGIWKKYFAVTQTENLWPIFPSRTRQAIKYGFLNGPTLASISFIFGLFKQTKHFSQQINVK